MGGSRQTASKWVNRGRRGVVLPIVRAVLIARRDGRRPRSRTRSCGRGSSCARGLIRSAGRSRSRLRRCMRSRAATAAPVSLPDRGRRKSSVTSMRSGRTGPRRHQEARPDPEAGPPSHRRPPRGQKGRAGWQHLFVAIDDHSRLGFAAVYRDETTDSAITFLDELVRFYGSTGSPGAGPDRQRQLLQTPLARRLRQPRDQREADEALPAPHQRQSRTVHPHAARTLGLRLHPRTRERQTRRPRSRPRLLQSLPSPPRPRRPHTAPTRQQRPWDIQLVVAVVQPLALGGRGDALPEVDG